MSNLPVYLIAISAYVVLSVFFLRTQLTGQAESKSRSISDIAVLIPLLLHGYLLYKTLWIAGALNLGLVNSLSLILWLTLLVYWLDRKSVV